MITWSAKLIFNLSAKKLVKGFYSNPRLKKSLQKYIDDTNEFKKELKRLGYGNQEDLKKALADNPDLPDWKNY